MPHVGAADHALSYSACNFRGNPLVLSPGLHVEGFKGRYPSAKAILTPPGLTVDLHRSLTLGPLVSGCHHASGSVGNMRQLLMLAGSRPARRRPHLSAPRTLASAAC